ncbi:MAG: serine/threonine-protein kinase [Planctomycetota bacterium]|jgi:serine/threonine protein kinase
MPPEKDNTPRMERIAAALAKFEEAWFAGRPEDVEAFIAAHPDCGPGLRAEIEDFLFVAERLRMKGFEDEAAAGAFLEQLKSLPNVLGDFRILGEIGRGGMGVVFEAEQISMRRKVALKILPAHLSFSPQAILKFRREAEAGGRQSHSGLVSIFAVGEHEGVHFIAQELVEGGVTVADKLEKACAIDELPRGYFRDCALLIAEVAEALAQAHAAGVIHRDIKPSNILLTREAQPKVTDFGLAKVEDALALSRSGDFAGTPYYMSPEQVASRRTGIDHRTDIYSLGVTLYEMLTLVRPFEADTTQEVLKKVLLDEPRDPHKRSPHVPRDLYSRTTSAVTCPVT